MIRGMFAPRWNDESAKKVIFSEIKKSGNPITVRGARLRHPKGGGLPENASMGVNA